MDAGLRTRIKFVHGSAILSKAKFDKVLVLGALLATMYGFSANSAELEVSAVLNPSSTSDNGTQTVIDSERKFTPELDNFMRNNDQGRALLNAKLRKISPLVSPDAVGQDYEWAGWSVSIDGNRALVGAPHSSDFGHRENGDAYIFERESSDSEWHFVTRLLPHDLDDNDMFGAAVSLFADRALVGSYQDDDQGENSGSAYVFKFNGKDWIEEAKLTPKVGSERALFGASVSLYGNRALVGAYRDFQVEGISGAAYLFEVDGAEWSETEKFIPDDNTGFSQFGYAVCLTDDRLAIGANFESTSGTSGAVYIYDYADGDWLLTTKLRADQGAFSSEFGSSISLAEDRVIVGAPSERQNNLSYGAAYIFDFTTQGWNRSAKFVPENGMPHDMFGMSVTLSLNTALVGSPLDDEAAPDAGAVYLYEYNGEEWVFGTKLIKAGAVRGENLGFSIESSGLGFIAGARFDNTAGVQSGVSYFLPINAPTWPEAVALLPPDGPAVDIFGSRVSIYGNYALIGALGHDGNGSTSGAAYIYEFVDEQWVEVAKLTPSDGASNDSFGSSVSLLGTRALIGASYSEVDSIRTGSVYIFEYDGVSWVETQKLYPQDVRSSARYGVSVAQDSERIMVGADQYSNDLINSGAVYFYEYDGSQWSQTERILPTDRTANAGFGNAISFESNFALIGASREEVSVSFDVGSVYVFEYKNGMWQQVDRLLSDELRDDLNFGAAVDLYDGYALIGAPGEYFGFQRSGAAYTYKYNGSNWLFVEKQFSPTPTIHGGYGVSVSLSDGFALVGEDEALTGLLPSGAAHLYERTNDLWEFKETLVPPNGFDVSIFLGFGTSVDLYENRAIIGTPGDNENGPGSGAAYLLDVDPILFDGFETL